MTEQFDFRTSSYSGAGANCVEAAPHPAGMIIRDSKDKTGQAIVFGREPWSRFLTEISADPA